MRKKQNQFSDFDTRLGRIERAHRAGGGFEAAGTLGRGQLGAARQRQRRRIPFQGLAMLALVLFLGKAVMMVAVGDGEYGSRVAHLAEGSSGERIAGMILQPDRVSLWFADLLRPYVA